MLMFEFDEKTQSDMSLKRLRVIDVKITEMPETQGSLRMMLTVQNTEDKRVMKLRLNNFKTNNEEFDMSHAYLSGAVIGKYTQAFGSKYFDAVSVVLTDLTQPHIKVQISST